MKVFINIFLIFIFNLSAYAYKIYPSAGSTSATFLKIPIGARFSAMGGTIYSQCEDISIIYYNPSYLSCFEGRTVYFSHNFHISDIKQSYISYGSKTKNIFYDGKAYYSISLNYLDIGSMEKRSGLYENNIFDASPVEGSFGSHDMALSFIYGFSYKNNYNFGFGLKFIRQDIDSDSGSTLAMDIGANKDISIKNKVYNLNLAISNIGRGIKLADERYDLPLSVMAGLSGDLERYGLKASFSVLKYIDNYPYLIVGMEKKVSNSLYARIGYRYRVYGNELGFWSGFSSGIGLSYNKFIFDYSLNPYGELGYSHKISLYFKF
jgi:hypothetical protein